jgi:hypothetical protein
MLPCALAVFTDQPYSGALPVMCRDGSKLGIMRPPLHDWLRFTHETTRYAQFAQPNRGQSGWACSPRKCQQGRASVSSMRVHAGTTSAIDGQLWMATGTIELLGSGSVQGGLERYTSWWDGRVTCCVCAAALNMVLMHRSVCIARTALT